MQTTETKDPGRLIGGIAVVMEVAAAALLLLAMLDMLLQVTARTLMPQSVPPWTEEAVRLLLVWISFVGASAATLRGLHLTIDLITIRSRRLRLVWDLAIALLVFGLGVALLYGGLVFAQFAARSATPGLRLPGYVYYVPIVIFSTVTLFHSFVAAVSICLSLAGLGPGLDADDEATTERED